MLLPTTNNKLLAQWQGSYKILCKTGPVNYLVDMHGTRNRRIIFHVNMLKRWYAPAAESYWAEKVPEEREGEDFPMWCSDDGQPQDPPTEGKRSQ